MDKRFFSFLGLTKKSGNLVDGYNKCEEYIKRSIPKLFIMSKDLAENSREKFLRFCDNNNIPVIDGLDKEELGYAIGKSEIKIICVKDENMAEKLLQLSKSL
ncbi:ribosomal L7Ae/L30e/S12e/Gadd45 family protein [Clostridium frigidicarnis]|uniref:Ribosomal protein L7Ae n=1 Tax=Clostridium frigidicarnis TaxID=84698 RepID=A0A1I0WNU5_9CLOT|nr:ribosomal L7Ae/L30e/S12e/Gadd45 family protein [Clostridium frigidicarnis]SFA89636.1 Ribosomal protein L7Ae [Clostridium frigidicarnis]